MNKKFDPYEFLLGLLFYLPLIGYSQGEDIDRLVERLDDEDVVVRNRAICAIAKIEDGRSVEAKFKRRDDGKVCFLR